MEKLRKEILVLEWRKEIEVQKKIVLGLKKAIEVAETYDGKVMNKRFSDTLRTATTDMCFSLDFSGSYPKLLYSLPWSCLRYDLPRGDYKLVQIGRYPCSLVKWENNGNDFVEYIDRYTRRLSFSSFRRVIEHNIERIKDQIEAEKIALKDVDKVLARAKKINEQIKKMREDFPYYGFRLENERLDFYYLQY